MTEKARLLVELLLDINAPTADRDDAAMDLEQFDDPEVLDALISVARNFQEEYIVLASVGTSIGQIWKRNGIVNLAVMESLSQPTRDEISAIVGA